MSLFGGFTEGYQGWKDFKNKNKKSQIENEYLPEKLAAENELLRNQAGIAGNTLKYAPKMSEAELAKMLIANEFAPRMNQADLNYKNAQTGLTTQTAKFMPLEMLIKAQQANQSTSRFGSAYQMSKALEAMSPPARELWISQNQDAYNDMIAQLGNKQTGNLITPEILNKYIPGSGSNGIAGNAPMMAPPRFAGSTPQQTTATKLANQMAANKALTTNATQRQLEGAIQVENIVNDPAIQSQVQNAAQYAGALRKGKAVADAMSQQNPKSYEDYLSFKNQTMVLLQNRIKTLDQMGATDSQREELQGLYNKTMDTFTSNPGQFITQWNNLTKTLDTIARSVQKSATPVAPVNRLEGAKPIGAQNYSEADLEYTAKKYGMTVDQVKKKLGAS